MIADEAVSIRTNVSTPVELEATTVAPVWPLQRRTHIQYTGSDGSAPPLPEFSEQAIWLLVWQVAHREDVDTCRSKMEVPGVQPEFQEFQGGGIKVDPSRQTTHIKVHVGPHGRR